MDPPPYEIPESGWTYLDIKKDEIIDIEMHKIICLYVNMFNFINGAIVMASLDGINFITLNGLRGHGSEKLEELPKYIKFKPHGDVLERHKIQIGFWKNLHSDFNWAFMEVEKDEIIDTELYGFLRLYVAFFGEDINCGLALMFSMDGINFKHSSGRFLGDI